MWTLAILIIIIGFYFITRKQKSTSNNSQTEIPEQEQKTTSYGQSYKPKWLFSYNEKDAYWKIKQVTDKLGMQLFAKVRLFDLIEPIPGIEHYKGAQGKIQAKHVDFVVCDSKLVAKIVIELDDNSHNKPDRQERDEFVDTVLTATGYKVLRLKAVDPEQLEAILK